jgi:hypothetical protein
LLGDAKHDLCNAQPTPQESKHNLHASYPKKAKRYVGWPKALYVRLVFQL